MMEKARAPIRIDLNRFKLHISIPDKLNLSLHFTSPSRKFYLSLIALVVHEMKKQGRITSIPMEQHRELLALLNETVGVGAGSSNSRRLFRRIYRKWKSALPDLEHAPLFRVLGHTKDFDDGLGKIYQFTDDEKDLWANLFEYKGSEEHVRLRFSVDKLGESLDDVAIIYGDLDGPTERDNWIQFVDDLKRADKKNRPIKHESTVKGKDSRIPALVRALLPKWQWAALGVLVLGIALGSLLFSRYSHLFDDSKEAGGHETNAREAPLPDKPSIAVLPFVNMTGDPEQEYFSDGLTEQIITTLSKIPTLLVIARNSSFAYKGKAVKVQRIAEDLDVRYVMEGSFRKSNERIRVTTQLIDATTGHHLWAETYDREPTDIFAIQDEITINITRAMAVELAGVDKTRLLTKSTNNLKAWEKLMEGRFYLQRFNPESNFLARKIFEEAIALDPNFSSAWSGLATTYIMDLWLGTSKSPRKSFKKALEATGKSLELDSTNCATRSVLGYIYTLRRQYEKALAEGERALELCPNSADARVWLAMTLNLSGRPTEAISLIEKAIRLNPHHPNYYLLHLTIGYRMNGDYEKALTTIKKAVEREPRNVLVLLNLTATLSLLGREKEARVAAANVLKVDSKFSLEILAKTASYKNKADAELLIGALRKAGLK